MQLAPILTRISEQMPDLRQVTAAATLPLAIEAIKTFPAACVFMPRGEAAKNTAVNAINQSVADNFFVILAVKNVRDMHGAAAAAEIDEMRPRLSAALLGWPVASGYNPIEYAGYQMLHYKEGLMLWADHFKTGHYARAPFR